MIKFVEKSYADLLEEIKQLSIGMAKFAERMGGITTAGPMPMPPDYDPDHWNELLESMRRHAEEMKKSLESMDELLKELFEHPDYPRGPGGGSPLP